MRSMTYREKYPAQYRYSKTAAYKVVRRRCYLKNRAKKLAYERLRRQSGRMQKDLQKFLRTKKGKAYELRRRMGLPASAPDDLVKAVFKLRALKLEIIKWT